VNGDANLPSSSRFKPMTVTLAGVAVLAAWMTLLPPHLRPWNLSVIGALGIFASARIGFWPAVGLTALALGMKDSVWLVTRAAFVALLRHLHCARLVIPPRHRISL
jgi:hypothetical protein